MAYQNTKYAERYAQFVERVRAAETANVPGSTELTESVARYLHKLMAYKDEYEVARLSLVPELRQQINEQFGSGRLVIAQDHKTARCCAVSRASSLLRVARRYRAGGSKRIPAGSFPSGRLRS